MLAQVRGEIGNIKEDVGSLKEFRRHTIEKINNIEKRLSELEIKRKKRK